MIPRPIATFGSVVGAFLTGAVTGGMGGAAGVVSTARGVLSIASGVVAGLYAGITTEGTVEQRIAVGVTTGLIATSGTYLGAGIDTSGFDTFGTAVANYSTTILVGTFTEPLAVATQQAITRKGRSVNSWNDGLVSSRSVGLNKEFCASVLS